MFKILTSILLTSALFWAVKEDSFTQKEVILNDGETTNIDSLFSIGHTPITVENHETLYNSAIIKSFNSEFNISDILKYINHIALFRGLSYEVIQPNASYWENDSTFVSNNTVTDPYYVFREKEIKDVEQRFLNYFHGLIRNKTARDILFGYSVKKLISTAKVYPKDFASRVYLEIKDLKKFTNGIENYNENDDFSILSYWKGFIWRRYANDQIGKDEILKYLSEVEKQLEMINLNENPEHFLIVKINNEIEFQYNTDYISIKSTANDKFFQIPRYSIVVNTIQHFRDSNLSLYKLKISENGEDPYNYVLLDSDLNILE